MIGSLKMPTKVGRSSKILFCMKFLKERNFVPTSVKMHLKFREIDTHTFSRYILNFVGFAPLISSLGAVSLDPTGEFRSLESIFTQFVHCRKYFVHCIYTQCSIRTSIGRLASLDIVRCSLAASCCALTYSTDVSV